MFKKIAFFFLLLSASACYKAPSEDELRTVPSTNNPHYIQDKTRTLGGLGY